MRYRLTIAWEIVLQKVGFANKKWPDASGKPNFQNYGDWLSAVHGVDLDREHAKYTSAAPKIVDAAKNSSLWTQYQEQRAEMDAAYFQATNYPLFAFPVDAEPQAKTWDSFRLKSFRRNVLNNEDWPNEPAGGWLLPSNWFEAVHDIVRTVLVVKYLDGVKHVTESLRDLALASHVEFTSDLQARDTGYYAAHTYSKVGVDLPNDSWQLKRHDIVLEIQVTTQLQEVIGQLTHHEYEKRRERPDSESKNWQWDHSSEAFQPNYLGHLLHYTEGMIMEVRERDRSK